jgi:hypothetical protein
MGYFFFWPKNGVSAIKVSLWYFKILSRFYLFNLCCWFFIMGDNFQWTDGSHLGHSSHSAAFWWFRFSSSFKICQEACHCRIFANCLGPFSYFCLKITALFFYFNQRPLSLYCVWKRWTYQEVRFHSPLNKVEDEDPISPVRTPVEFTLFSIIETPTTNQGKRGSMSYIVLFYWQPFKAIIYFSVFDLWHEFDFSSFLFLITNLIERTLHFSILDYDFLILASAMEFWIMSISTSTNTSN